MNWYFQLAASVLFALSFDASGSSYSAVATEARVVDAETRAPLEGVIVVAHWVLEYGLEGGGRYQLTVMETTTDQEGRFTFPAWGPKEVPPSLPSEARLKDRDPSLLLFKPGYGYVGLQNDRSIRSMSGHGASVRHSDWHGTTVSMKKFQGTLQQDKLNIDGLASSLSFLSDDNNCEWKQAPRIIVALNEEDRRLRNAGFRRRSFPSIDDLPNQPQCGSATEFFKPYLKDIPSPEAEVHKPPNTLIKAQRVPIAVPSGTETRAP